MVEAYGYLAAYEVNHEKDYAQAVDLFEKVLEVDPENASAKKYITILEKNHSGTDVTDEEKDTTQKDLTNKGS
jgi:lipoprotein NlpI